MKKVLASLFTKFITVDMCATVIAKLIAKLLKYASAKGGDKWTSTKATIKKVNVWTKLFVQVYDDDTLTEEEEKMIADAISDETSLKKVIDILQQ